jgi:hypothetical protein
MYPHINSSFGTPFQRTLFDVVRYDPNTTDQIPGGEAGGPGSLDLEQFFGASGLFCSPRAATIIEDYGFLPVPGTTPPICIRRIRSVQAAARRRWRASGVPRGPGRGRA